MKSSKTQRFQRNVYLSNLCCSARQTPSSWSRLLLATLSSMLSAPLLTKRTRQSNSNASSFPSSGIWLHSSNALALFRATFWDSFLFQPNLVAIFVYEETEKLTSVFKDEQVNTSWTRYDPSPQVTFSTDLFEIYRKMAISVDKSQQIRIWPIALVLQVVHLHTSQ